MLSLQLGELNVFLAVVDAVVVCLSFYFVHERSVEVRRELVHSLPGEFVSNFSLTLDGSSDLLASKALFALARFTSASLIRILCVQADLAGGYSVVTRCNTGESVVAERHTD